MLRTALEALTLRLDGSRAAANTIIRKRAVLHGALGYAAEAGLLPDNPLDTIGWQVPQSSAAVDPMMMASPAEVSALLEAVNRIRPEMTAFFGCLYYAALRLEEAVALRYLDCRLPGSGWPQPRPGPPSPGPAAAPATNSTEASGYTNRATGADAVRYTSVTSPPGPPTARRPRQHQTGIAIPVTVIYSAQKQYWNKMWTPVQHPVRPTAGPKTFANCPRTARTSTQKPVTSSGVTGLELRK